MKVLEIMSGDVLTCEAGESVNRAARLMWENRCGSVAIVDPTRRVIGILTDRDACMAAYTQGKALRDIPIATAMSKTVHACGPSADLDEVQEAMMLYRVQRLVVLDADGRAMGIISLDDIARAATAWDGQSRLDLEKVALTLAEIARRSERTPTWPEPEASNLREVIRNSLDVLRTLRDEIRVDLSLASKEMRDRWRLLESQVHLAEARARATREDGAASLRTLVDNVKKFRGALRRPESAPRR